MAYTDKSGIVHNSFYETDKDLGIEPKTEEELIEYKRFIGMPISEDYDELIENLKGTTEGEISPMAVALSKALQDDELLEHTASIMKRMCDGEPVNKNPLTEIPTPQMVLYGFSGAFKSAYFDTEEELEEYVKTHDTSFGGTCVIEYLGNVAGRSDVIRTTSKNRKPMLLTVCDRDGYGIYNEERSIYRGEFVWEYNNGDIKDMYSAFRDRGIVFEDDIYGELAEQDRKLLQMCREKNLFNMGKK